MRPAHDFGIGFPQPAYQSSGVRVHQGAGFSSGAPQPAYQSAGVVVHQSAGFSSGLAPAGAPGQQAVVHQADGHPNVAIRSNPGDGGPVLGTINNGQLVHIVSEMGEFSQIRWQQHVGFVKNRNLRKVAGAPMGNPAGFGGAVASGAAPSQQLRRGSTGTGLGISSPCEYVWQGQKFSSLQELETAVQARTGPSSMMGLKLKDMLAPQYKAHLETKIKQLFHQYAGADRKLQQHEMFSLAAVLAAELRIPQTSFGNLTLMFHRYDFSGNGDLDETEGTMLIEGMLRAYRDSQDSEKLGVATGEVIPYKPLESAYDLVKELGKGGQGAVYLATDKSNQQNKVVKFYDKANANMPLDDIIDEFALLTSLDHPRIARTYEIFQDAKNIYAISEPYFGGDLTTAIDKATQNGVAITPEWLTALWRQVCQGLVFLHSKHVMHCDLKEPNVMISGTENWSAPNVVLIDFGCAKNFSGEARGGGTPGYMPPEVWTHNLWTTKGDTFSMGVMMYRMATRGRVPFGQDAGMDINRWRDSSVACILPPTPPELAQQPQLNTLICRMLHKDFKQRPTMANILDDSWFSQGAPLVNKAGTRKLTAIGEKHDLHVALLADLASRENLSQLEDASKLFASLDADHSGELTKEEFRQGLQGRMPSDQIEALIEAIIGPSGNVSYTRFMGHMLAQKQKSTTVMLHKLFQEIDQDKSGFLDFNEIDQMLKKPQVAEVMEGVSAQELMKEMDMNGSGSISWPEFQRFLDKRFHGEMPWKAGEPAEYWSNTHQMWVQTQVTNFDPPSGAVMLACKPNFWIDKPTQAKSVRKPPK